MYLDKSPNDIQFFSNIKTFITIHFKIKWRRRNYAFQAVFLLSSLTWKLFWCSRSTVCTNLLGHKIHKYLIYIDLLGMDCGHLDNYLIVPYLRWRRLRVFETFTNRVLFLIIFWAISWLNRPSCMANCLYWRGTYNKIWIDFRVL